jgi:adenylate cyclase
MTENAGLVLVVDDDSLNRMLLTTNLQQQGYTVTSARDGKQALELLHAQPFDVVLLDLLMPEMDGYQVLAKMKQDPVLRHLPVIVISALDEMESVIRCIEMGATDYLSKPFDPVLLRARLNASLVNKRLHDIEQAHLKAIQVERERADRLLLNILPAPIA